MVIKQTTNKKVFWFFWFFWFIGLLFFFGFLGFKYFQNISYLKALEFNGVVASIKYGREGDLYVNISGKEYYLSGAWNFRHSINVGDVLVKNKNELIVEKIDKDTKQIEIFK